ncbi:hypothetical protein BATDEDRAFT_33390 [Batrachochytrium dendrobatidis JAM81]|uniref:Peptide hydrolase n=1 Tax=Batrachochytrium dendrobatidis (strain JAM81 / FGSC 10211) TaxID=684364 RepID=F4P5V4_BATDJ|nr:uncharacterized protein BATDEDRAFT_33390 [Batrachochytrium dendrobatidis JAM81]EGF79493.1 hypothetical protein BATDEDRAFT_33390 [Batrachochytrium dendrobatidis JAM81]KAJ8322832.1 hypothetical protein O5D80_008362 [Batrachochytrium dendrobatidis]KAK5665851.1 hypothetical protein QVD99_007477 [Batrachochytrium dendrobatidis]|eukprot:XP_006679966.1 hypothetical protein BATDEDRAFT_33390 [Batrachochytrium dendrobatidis JAM81]
MRLATLSAASILAFSLSVLAVPFQQDQDLLQNDPFARRLISFSEGQSQWMNEEQIFGLYRSNTKFIDITDGDMDSITFFQASTTTKKDYPSLLSQQSKVTPIIDAISQDGMKQFLTSFSGFKTRYFRSSSGIESSKWLQTQVQDLADSHGRNDVSLSVKQFKHSWGQASIIARFEATGSAKDENAQDIIVISAHQDSVNQFNPWFGRSPGADDDGSGSTTIFEVLTRLLKSDFVPNRPVEFHWYSGEEGGLLGSQKVVADYMKRKVDVYANFHNDMTGYQPKNKKPVIGISTDFVDPKLSTFLQHIVEGYSSISWAPTKCGYACSDHATWNKAGVPTVFTFEAPFADHSPYIHTSDDTVEHIDFGHMAEFVKSVIGFTVELSLYGK